MGQFCWDTLYLQIKKNTRTDNISSDISVEKNKEIIKIMSWRAEITEQATLPTPKDDPDCLRYSEVFLQRIKNEKIVKDKTWTLFVISFSVKKRLT